MPRSGAALTLYRWLLGKHITPYLSGVPVGKVSTAMIREWWATLLGNGVSVSMAAKAYRLLRAVLMTAVEEDKILLRNPCRIRGAGDEDAPERPVLTLVQVFALAELVGRRPVGNIRKLPAGGYRLRFQRHGVMRTSPEVYAVRAEAERALWQMADDGRADCTHDRRYLALVLLATFASPRWGEVTALRRCDIDLEAGTVRIRAAFVERSTGEILLGPPKSKAGRRMVGIPQAIIPVLREHLSIFVKDEPGALVFPGVMGGPLRRGNFNRMSAWPYAARSVGAEGLHFHDLRHTGNTFAAASGAGLRDDPLMARKIKDGVRVIKAGLRTPALNCTNLAGAGDENRTRTISLGMSAGTALISNAAGRQPCWLVHEYSRGAVGDLPAGHVAGTPAPVRLVDHEA